MCVNVLLNEILCSFRCHPGTELDPARCSLESSSFKFWNGLFHIILIDTGYILSISLVIMYMKFHFWVL
jgi:hypothetical protein